jgi:hypothetical protein
MLRAFALPVAKLIRKLELCEHASCRDLENQKNYNLRSISNEFPMSNNAFIFECSSTTYLDSVEKNLFGSNKP